MGMRGQKFQQLITADRDYAAWDIDVMWEPELVGYYFATLNWLVWN